MLAAIALAGFLLCACAGGRTAPPSSPAPSAQPAPPSFFTANARNGAAILRLQSSTAGATIYYTTDGTTPTTASLVYEAPFLNCLQTRRQRDRGCGRISSHGERFRLHAEHCIGHARLGRRIQQPLRRQRCTPIPRSGTTTRGTAASAITSWKRTARGDRTRAPCSTASPNAYVGTDGYLHIAAQQPSPGVYTSARLKSQGLFSVQYGRIEFRALVPEAQGSGLPHGSSATTSRPSIGLPAARWMFWSASTLPKSPDWNEGSVHGVGFTGDTGLGTVFNFPTGQTAAQWHTYGMIWKKGQSPITSTIHRSPTSPTRPPT